MSDEPLAREREPIERPSLLARADEVIE
jgi:hypothetical protein